MVTGSQRGSCYSGTVSLGVDSPPSPGEDCVEAGLIRQDVICAVFMDLFPHIKVT